MQNMHKTHWPHMTVPQFLKQVFPLLSKCLRNAKEEGGKNTHDLGDNHCICQPSAKEPTNVPEPPPPVLFNLADIG